MNDIVVDRIARAVLYEGYNLYPYRASSVKNQQRFNFGVLAPRSYSDAQDGAEAYANQAEVLIAGASPTVEVSARFLHLVAREVSDASPWPRIVPSLDVDGRLYTSWQEAVERDIPAQAVPVDALAGSPSRIQFAVEGRREVEPIHDDTGIQVGDIVREQWRVEGTIEIAATRVADDLTRVRVAVVNTTQFEGAHRRSRDEALLRSLVSAHTVLRVQNGAFVSLLDPPAAYRDAARACSNNGLFPVLVGAEGDRSLMLAAPIILYDYPQIAPESAGDLFDGTEIDEILTLRIMTLTDDEKREMRGLDDRTRRILERTETMPAEQLMKLHGALRGLRPSEPDTQ